MTSLKTHRFMEANTASPVVYVSLDPNACVYRLANGSVWRLSLREAREVGVPRFAHLEAA